MYLLKVLITASIVISPVDAVVRDGSFTVQTDLPGVIFTEHLLYTFQAGSKGMCGANCMQNALCVSFTFTGGKQSGNCRGHSKLMTFLDLTVVEAGAKLFVFRETADWPGKSCSTDSDCGTRGQVLCRRNTCVCTPGYYYSESLNQCLSDCPVSKLTSNFMAYLDAGLAGHNRATVYGDADSCKQDCLQAVGYTCLNLEFSYNNNRANLQDATSSRDPGLWIDNDFGWFMFQRNCQ